VLCWVVFPACLAVVAGSALLTGTGVDFDANIWAPGKAVLAGRSPYPRPELGELVRPFFLYPPLLLGISIPWSVFPHDIGRALFFAAEVGGVVGALALVGVTDRRVWMWAVLSYPVFDALLLGNPSLLLLLPVAAAWRWRHDWRLAALAVGVAGAFKLLAWPLGVWLLSTRRMKAAIGALVVACVAILLPWALIGFDGLGDYRTIASVYTEHNGGPRAITLAGLAHALGLSWGAGHAVQWLGGLALLGAAFVQGRSRRPGTDVLAFTLTLVAALVLSPVVWIHYLAVLLVPLAVISPSFDRTWIVVCSLWVFPLLPRADTLTIVVDGRSIESGGAVPTVPQLCVAFAFMAFVIVQARPAGRLTGVRASAPARV
jgi:alpha-1,2-mannosyltransferase